ncbi:hypothetical protein BDN71DRAFT_1437965 [Pleurotus eryngii]|uniref:PB1 domain-containing protein n=1 Tax=Pleurotus eryngii TaxID=5323 RepID=A0A9P6DLF5_PLEER|nr:hypothetical protein BDN71DRAFT_1437965 [Pleurotus eryngii]
MITTFKLTKRDGFTRRITFPSWPDWQTLAQKIESLYNIPFDNIGVSYVDNDGDEVTLSSQEELEDYRFTTYEPGKLAKFIVQDISAQLMEEKSLPETPRASDARNTFGADGLVYTVGIEDDWQPNIFIPKGPLMSGSTTPHAYVETVDDSEPAVPAPPSQHKASSASSLVSSSQFGTVKSSADKGKSRANSQPPVPPRSEALGSDSDGMSSTVSLLAEDSPAKQPVHVYNRCGSTSNKSGFHVPSSSSRAPTSRGDVTPVQAESTPKVLAQSLNLEHRRTPDTTPPTNSAPDPPLPSIESLSLSNDVALLLNNLTSAFSSHPELAKSLRQIVQNASNGAYWVAHREAITNAAQELVRSAEATGRAAEEEAGRRVAEAVGGIVKSLADATSGIATTNSADASNTTTSARPARPLESGYAPWQRHRWAPSWQGGLQPFGFAYSRPRWPDMGMFGPPPPHHGHDHSRPFPPPPPPSGPFGDPHPPMSPGGAPPYPPPSWPLGGPPGPAPWDVAPDFGTHDREDSRAHVEAAKSLYKAEKERYRQEREARRKEKERLASLKHGNTELHGASTSKVEEEPKPAPPPPKPQTPPVVQTVSNARGGFPEFEMYNVPKRHNTHLGHSHRRGASSVSRPGPSAENTEERALAHMTKRLADMGFTESAYPSLPAKIRENMPENGPITKEKEDDIVTTLLEDMLAMSPKPPKGPGSPSGSTPGGWRF